MITIIHGDDTAQSRFHFITLRDQTQDALTFAGEKMTITDFTQATQGGELFTTEKHIFIEGLLSRKKSIELDSILAAITKTDSAITLWEGKQLTKAVISKFKNATVKEFSFPQVLFQFLDALGLKKSPEILKLYHELLQTNEAEMVLFMMIRQVRLLLALTSSDAKIEEVKRLAPWQYGKLQKQAHAISQPRLLVMHEYLTRLELGSKTGILALPLPSAIDIFLLEN